MRTNDWEKKFLKKMRDEKLVPITYSFPSNYDTWWIDESGHKKEQIDYLGVHTLQWLKDKKLLIQTKDSEVTAYSFNDKYKNLIKNL